MNRRSLKFYTYVSVVTLCFVTILHTLIYRPEAVSTVILEVKSSFAKNRQEALKDALTSVTISPIKKLPVSPLEFVPDYDRILALKKGNLWNPINKKYYKPFQELDIDTRCKFYFRQLYTMNEKWSNDLDQVSFFINDVDNEKFNELKDSDGILLVDEETVRLHKRKNDIALAFQRARIYDKCFIQTDVIDVSTIFTEKRDSVLLNAAHEKEDAKQKSSDKMYMNYDQFDFERRMFPFLNKYTPETFKDMIPKMTIGDGITLKEGVLPVHDPETGHVIDTIEYEYNSTQAFWSNWNSMSHIVANKGIVLSFGDKHMDMALRLISTLRLQGNTLPIQVIIVDDDLSKESIERLNIAARDSNIKLPRNSFSNTTNTPQELWFLDVTKTLHRDFKGSFKGFKSKWTAVMFNLFEEFIFMDVDAINYVDFERYFENEGYKETGALFFRDRNLKSYLRPRCVAIFQTLPPRLLESKYFGNIPFIDKEFIEGECEKYLTPAEKVFKRYLMDNYSQQMESGLMVINKSKKNIPLVLAQMLHNAKKVVRCSYGDKEFFWIGFAVAGVPYSFHEVPAGAVGPYRDVKRNGDDESGRICAIQLAHFDTDNTLLWLNGGSRNCKFPGEAAIDWKEPENKEVYRKFKTEEEFEKFYDQDTIESDYGIISGETNDNWHQLGKPCRGYNWCVRYETKLKEFSFDERTSDGKLIKFSGEEHQRIKGINAVWAEFDTEAIKA